MSAVEGVPLGLLILLILAGLILLTPGGRSLLWGRWGIVEPKDSPRRGKRRSPCPGMRNPFAQRFGRFGGRC